ncbi:MAG: hypothetical protein PWR13_1253 [Archaeoglobi archaeon]|nr:hypothetical protein [Candidatus Mnemosynella bozhongmuii]MDI3502788.1 hypothetical protein [Archaeoglobi archaeon]MDK2782225.1 hypothetical protein [Archaeoglobi archaeon]
MEIVRFDEMEKFNTPEGVMTPLFVSEKIAVIHFKFPAGLKVEPHSHPRDSVMVITKGKVRLRSEKGDVELGSRDLAYIPADFVTGLECEEEAEAIAITVGARYKTMDELKEILRRISNADR